MDDGWREVIAEWKGDGSFIGSNFSGGNVQMGTLEGKPGLSPMELLLIGLAGCTGIDIANTLKKKRLPLDSLQVKVRGKRAETHPRVYTEIEVVYLISGDRLDNESVEHAIQLSEEKYCSAGAMLREVAKIHSSYQILSP